MRIIYNLTHDYLEVARGAMTNISHSNLSIEDNRLINTIFSGVSITIIYSYLAIESFVNYELFKLWERRNDGSNEANLFLDIFDDKKQFKELLKNDKARELKERFKTICKILNYQEPQKTIAPVWQDFNDLVKVSRHFLVHPYPDKEYFQKHMERILEQTKTGKYVSVAENLIKYLYECGGKSPPEWLSKNTLFRLKGIEILDQR